jgi:ABC-type polysaccharide/polyol phosphate export permease
VPIVAVLGLGLMWMTLSPITTALLIIMFSVFGILIDSIILEPIAWMLEREN